MAHDNFYAQHPRATKLGLKPVPEHHGYDLEDVQKALGAKFTRFQSFIADKSVFVCGHRTVPHDVTDDNGKKAVQQVEAHCVYAKDLEDFLNAES